MRYFETDKLERENKWPCRCNHVYRDHHPEFIEQEISLPDVSHCRGKCYFCDCVWFLPVRDNLKYLEWAYKNEEMHLLQ